MVGFPSIAGFTPSVPGGDEKVLTITGSEFGALIGKIQFQPNCFVPRDGYVELDNYDMNFSGGLVKWSNDTIKVRIPGFVRVLALILAGNEIYANSDLCTSKFRVVKSTFFAPDSTSSYTSTALEIPYSITQNVEVDPSDESQVIDKRLVQISAANSTEEAIQFEVSQAIIDDCEVLMALQEAMQEWSCKMGVNWGIHSISAQDTAFSGDGLNTIYYNSDLQNPFDSTRVTLGRAEGIETTCSNLNKGEIIEYDFALNPNLRNEDYDLIVFTALHEMGHLIGLRHTQPLPGGTNDLMGPIYISSSTEPFTSDDITAANIVRSRSELGVCGTEINFENFGDYGMRNTLSDTGSEPDCIIRSDPDGEPDIYKSPDVFNCQDPGTNSCNGINEQPLEGNTNYIHARITNFSDECIVYSGIVEFYWTIGSTGEMWEEDWINDIENGCLIGDFIGSRQIGTLNPGETRIVERDWVPPIINDLVDCDIYRYPWDVEKDRWQICLLARIVSDYDNIMLERKDISIGDNIINSNNLATINTALLDDPDLLTEDSCYVGKATNMILHNNNSTTQTLDFVFKIDPSSVGAGTLEDVEVILPALLAQQISASYTTPDNLDAIRLQGDEVILNNIQMNANQKFAIGIRVSHCNIGRITPRSESQLISFSVGHRSSTGAQIRRSSYSHFYLQNDYTEIASEIQSALPCSNNSTLADFTIYSIDGRLVKTVKNMTRASFDLHSNIMNLKSGVYIVIKKVHGQHCETYKKFIM